MVERASFPHKQFRNGTQNSFKLFISNFKLKNEPSPPSYYRIVISSNLLAIRKKSCTFAVVYKIQITHE
ncbi:hypothetical protein DWY73_20155 [Bacteroides fragilis]|uniref:Uncharacterized protein n=1 Tax=Bacteroides fragilis TaxID=817 RepID=A0AB38PST4_BACFG|nr:hypothetical protein F9Z90_15195 [Bacteroides fragilis]KAB5422814.1 hypothetical protein F9000_04800 [Bacteroides fragilis]KAB5431601.1 hypothetical protein F9Z99_04800 [Bacteroides fragilis]KAB7794442.1 hypothetical protein E5C01_07230 [Bacteroides fragilis]QCT80165.1 hypothetical protein E0L14_08440 [Bacteroides fragilis]